MRKLSYRAYLEIEDENGERVFVATPKILQSAELQHQCVEKAVLRRIINRLRKHGLGPAQLDA
jgi:hypothetical protein